MQLVGRVVAAGAGMVAPRRDRDVLLPWRLCLQVKGLMPAALQVPTGCSRAQKLKDRAHRHTQGGTTAVEGEKVEDLSGQKQWAAGLEPKRWHFKWLLLSLEILSWRGQWGGKQVKFGQMLCVEEGLERWLRRLGRLRAAGTGNKMKKDVHVADQGIEKQKRNGCRCEAPGVAGLDKIRFKINKLEIHQFLTSFYCLYPLLPFHCG